MKTYVYSLSELTELCNQVKDSLANTLGIPELDRFSIIVAEPSLLGKFFDFVKVRDSGLRMVIVEMAKPIKKSKTEETT